eukprot:TRINITY_DN1840_c0_g1_i13.p1 TRINITY_DN1840_c0_g1~~TRINITY_DN1840_c0_g1_i13.p1  ORF type:complete len:163 (+),score=30.18 TRINITY_DN1840_c0_g1_i13:149-637(+)
MSTPQPLKELLDVGSNASCFECHQTSDWASTSLGLFLCLQHAGEHRSLGTHLSKVRSFHLDFWNERQILYLRKGGNDRARVFLSSSRDRDGRYSYSSKVAEEYRRQLQREVDTELGVEMVQPIQLSPELVQFSGATSIGSSDLREVNANDESCWEKCGCTVA